MQNEQNLIHEAEKNKRSWFIAGSYVDYGLNAKSMETKVSLHRK